MEDLVSVFIMLLSGYAIRYALVVIGNRIFKNWIDGDGSTLLKERYSKII